MSMRLNILAGLALAAFVAACGGQTVEEQEFVVVPPEPISVEPEYTGKYK